MTTSSLAPAPPARGSTAHSGVRFRETMAGWFALGVADPAEGARQGRVRGTRLRMRAAISIPDLDAFLADREHGGAIAGEVDFAPLGTGLRAERGDFRLFAPDGADDSGRRLMVYELTVAHDGGALHLAGRKLVRGGNPLRMWPETTTLYTTLHRDGIPTPIGAGILTLGALDFLAILPTLEVPGVARAGTRLATLARFGRFFVGELWNSYVRGDPPTRHA